METHSEGYKQETLVTWSRLAPVEARRSSRTAECEN